METLRYVVLANGLLAVVSLAYYVLLRRETFFGANRLALWVGLAGALILPLLELPDWRPQRVRTVMHRTAQIIVPKVLPKSSTTEPDVTITFPNQKTYQAFQKLPKPFSWSWQLGLILLYALGVGLLTIRFGLQVLSLRKLINRSTQESYDQFTLVTNEQVTSPFSFFNWVVLNPAQHSISELDQILRHERVHVRERHSLDMIGAEMVCIIFWFNPAAYLFRQLVHQTLEFSADRTVLAEGVDAKAYQYNLLKVSLASGQSGISNHFSKSQLKSRILMLNQRDSSKVSWLKYPVFFIAALTVASAFGRSEHIIVLSHYLPKPIATSMIAITSAPEDVVIEKVRTLTEQREIAKLYTKPTHHPEPATQQAEQIANSNESPTDKDSVRTSPSRYIVYEHNRMWWLITPKATLEDLLVLNKELAKYNYVLQVLNLKYDPLYQYIDRLDYRLVNNTTGSSTGREGDSASTIPIYSTGGYIEWDTSSDSKKYRSTSYGEIRPSAQIVPLALRKVIVEDESIANKYVRYPKMESLITQGLSKLSYTGNRAKTFRKENFETPSDSLSELIVQPDGSLAVNEALTGLSIYINNYPASPETVRIWSIKQLYAVVRKSNYDRNTQKESLLALLIYTIED